MQKIKFKIWQIAPTVTLVINKVTTSQRVMSKNIQLFFFENRSEYRPFNISNKTESLAGEYGCRTKDIIILHLGNNRLFTTSGPAEFSVNITFSCCGAINNIV